MLLTKNHGIVHQEIVHKEIAGSESGSLISKPAIGVSNQFPVGLSVLVVDDDVTCLKILEQMLRRCSYHVTTCSQATAALNM